MEFVAAMRQTGNPMALMAASRIAQRPRLRVHLLHVQLLPGNVPTMTRTPTTSVTAIAFAARASAWNEFLDARFSGIASEIPLPLLPLLR
jgi:hypothetical protein